MKANDMRPGNIIVMEGELYRCAESVHKTPGNLRAFIQARLVRIKDGIQKELRFASTDDLEKADLQERSMQYLYNDPSGYYFMDTENYEQISMTAVQLGSNAHYLLPESVIDVTLHNGHPIGVVLPQSMEFKVIEAEPGMRAATASASYKTAKIETGHAIKVPQFVCVGDVIRVNTATDEYLDRAKSK